MNYPQQLVYHSPYSINLSGAPQSIYAGLYSITSMTAANNGGWGPNTVPNVPPVIPSDVPAADVSAWLQERLLAAYQTAIGLDYQHHHVPSWLPEQGSYWNLTGTVGYQSEGVDCTDLTAYAYADALGIDMTSGTPEQGSIGLTTTYDPVIPASLKGVVSISTITHWTSYDNLISQLQPGDILFIHGAPGQITHAITWLGIYGVDHNGQRVPLIIDSTGVFPPHVNSNNQVIPEGVEIRPFGPPGSINDWYYDNLDHVLRLIDPPPS